MEQCVSAPSASLRPRWLTVRRSTYLTGHRLSAIVGDARWVLPPGPPGCRHRHRDGHDPMWRTFPGEEEGVTR